RQFFAIPPRHRSLQPAVPGLVGTVSATVAAAIATGEQESRGERTVLVEYLSVIHAILIVGISAGLSGLIALEVERLRLGIRRAGFNRNQGVSLEHDLAWIAGIRFQVDVDTEMRARGCSQRGGPGLRQRLTPNVEEV